MKTLNLLKRVAICIILLASVSFYAVAQSLVTIPVQPEQTVNKSFEGVWQMGLIVQSGDKEIKVRPLSIFKIYDSDQHFQNISFITRAGLGVVMTKGTYRLDDEHSYTEAITHSLTDPKLIGKENVLQYSFVNDNTLLVSYQLPGSNQMGREIWMRMVMPVLKEKSAQNL